MEKIHRQNAEALARQEHEPMMKLIQAYQAGEDIEVLLEDAEFFRPFEIANTRPDAVLEYIKQNYSVKKTRTGSKLKSKAKE